MLQPSFPPLLYGRSCQTAKRRLRCLKPGSSHLSLRQSQPPTTTTTPLGTQVHLPREDIWCDFNSQQQCLLLCKFRGSKEFFCFLCDWADAPPVFHSQRRRWRHSHNAITPGPGHFGAKQGELCNDGTETGKGTELSSRAKTGQASHNCLTQPGSPARQWPLHCWCPHARPAPRCAGHLLLPAGAGAGALCRGWGHAKLSRHHHAPQLHPLSQPHH